MAEALLQQDRVDRMDAVDRSDQGHVDEIAPVLDRSPMPEPAPVTSATASE
jgi:hypothetical protein